MRLALTFLLSWTLVIPSMMVSDAEAFCQELIRCQVEAREDYKADKRDCLRDRDKKGDIAVRHCMEEARAKYNEALAKCCNNAAKVCRDLFC